MAKKPIVTIPTCKSAMEFGTGYGQPMETIPSSGNYLTSRDFHSCQEIEIQKGKNSDIKEWQRLESGNSQQLEELVEDDSSLDEIYLDS